MSPTHPPVLAGTGYEKLGYLLLFLLALAIWMVMYMTTLGCILDNPEVYSPSSAVYYVFQDDDQEEEEEEEDHVSVLFLDEEPQEH